MMLQGSKKRQKFLEKKAIVTSEKSAKKSAQLIKNQNLTV